MYTIAKSTIESTHNPGIFNNSKRSEKSNNKQPDHVSSLLLHLIDRSKVPSVGLDGLKGILRTPLRSPLAVLRSAWLRVSMVNSPVVVGRGWMESTGLPRGLLLGDISTPLTDGEPLVGGEVPSDRIGDGDLLFPDDRELRPATYIWSLLPACSACSDWTISENEMKLSRRTSELSREA